jgi:hypothetical protein
VQYPEEVALPHEGETETPSNELPVLASYVYTRSEVFVTGYMVIEMYDVSELTMVAVVVAVVKPVFVAVNT